MQAHEEHLEEKASHVIIEKRQMAYKSSGKHWFDQSPTVSNRVQTSDWFVYLFCFPEMSADKGQYYFERMFSFPLGSVYDWIDHCAFKQIITVKSFYIFQLTNLQFYRWLHSGFSQDRVLWLYCIVSCTFKRHEFCKPDRRGCYSSGN